MRRNIVFILFTLAVCSVKSQTLSNEWVSKANGGKGSEGFSIATDDSGNVVTAGRFNGTVDFDPSPTVYNMSSIATKNLTDIYILKQDKSGNFIWARRFGASWWEYVYSMCLDDSGNIYFSGSFRDSVDFDPGVAEFKLIASIADQGFVCKLDKAGNFIWAKTIGAKIVDMAVDSLSNCYFSGNFKGTVDFDPGNGTFNLSSGPSSVYIVKLNNTGAFEWAKKIAGGDVYAAAITVDRSGNSVHVGDFYDSADFNPDAGIYKLKPFLARAMFICKLNTKGEFVWAVKVDRADINGQVSAAKVITDLRGNVYTTGTFNSTIDFDPGADSVKKTGDHDVYVCKLNASGKFKFIKQFSCKGSIDYVYSIVTDNRNNVYLAGNIYNSMDFAPSSGGYVLKPDSGYLFISCMDSLGNLFWAKNYGSVIDWRNSSIDQIAANKSGNLFLTGYFSDTADFMPGNGKIQLISTPSSYDAYLLKLKNCFPTSATIAQKACFSYTSPSKKHLWTLSGSYKDTISSNISCDSFFTINLTIDTVNVKVTNSSPTLTAVETGATYQWLDCNNGYAEINGATNQSYLATVNGSFAVVVSKHGCSDTSACFTVNNAGLFANSTDLGIKVYPNPTNGEVNIETGDFEGALRVQIHNSAGQTVKSYIFKQHGLLRITMPDISGLYLIELKSETKQKANFYLIKN